jgi:hypothetical protein
VTVVGPAGLLLARVTSVKAIAAGRVRGIHVGGLHEEVDAARTRAHEALHTLIAPEVRVVVGDVHRALLRRRTLWSRGDAPALREIVRLFRDGFADHTGRLDHGLIAA